MVKFIKQSPRKVLKAFLKQKPLRGEIDMFKGNLIELLDKINLLDKQQRSESEEHLKNNLRDFLRDTYYKDGYAINTKDKKDLVVHLGKNTDSDVGVIIEAKRPSNIYEMVSFDNPNKKALHELVFYYLDERRNKNTQLKHLVITNVHEWFIIDSNYFDKYIYRNPRIKKLYEAKLKDKKDNPFFYEEISNILSELDADIPCVYFNIKEYENVLRNSKKEDDKELVALYKILSPHYLLKAKSSEDSNSLNASFYKELLHILGLEEAKEGGKNVIRRKKEIDEASLIELVIEALDTEDSLSRMIDSAIYGDNKPDKMFNVAMELCITWINRVLFLKLLEGQLVAYHQGNNEYKFLSPASVPDFDELFKLFHKVLAVDVDERSEAVRNKYIRVPYLNSSLFEISELENKTLKINSLDNSLSLKLWSGTILKEQKESGNLPTLEYLLRFLDAYDFSSEGAEDVQEDNKSIINASVLGKVFEKINGYKDGSIYTPAFITMYMCRETIRKAVVDKFNVVLSEKDDKLFDQFADVKNYVTRFVKTQDILNVNSILNSLHICDPAVGSGHFLVSALNEMIMIKAELGILCDEGGNILSGYEFEIINDDLIITDQQGTPVEYKIQKGKPVSKELQRLQKTLFHEKQTIIENCLFGVDINPKSVLICRLRLWIELLKNAYYREPDYKELETLPNIDINIKCGNSLLSRFPLHADLSRALKSIKYDIQAYRGFVEMYKTAKNRDEKKGLLKIIDSIKSDFRTEIGNNDPKQVKLKKLNGDLFTLLNQGQIFDLNPKEQKVRREKQKKLEIEINKLAKQIEEIKNNAVYKNAFEWRFEFPEVLNNNGDFEGFDVIIGNPPYIQMQKLDETLKNALSQQSFETFTKTGDIYQLFYEKGVWLLKQNGILSYITSNKWMRTDYGATTRMFLSTKCAVQLVMDFGMIQLFDSATTYTSILLLNKASANSTIRMCRANEDYNESISLELYVKNFAVDIENPGTKSWIAYDKKEYALIQKIITMGKPLKDWDVKINRGILTGYNDAFIIDTATRDRLVAEDPRSAEIIHPLLRGEDIKAYVPDWKGKWLINAHNGVKSSNIQRVDVEKDYPAIHKWFLRFETFLVKRQDKGDHWTNLRNCAYIEEFYKDKIIYPNMTKYMPFVYDKHQFFTN